MTQCWWQIHASVCLVETTNKLSVLLRELHALLFLYSPKWLLNTAEKILQAYPHDLHGSKETSALFKRPIPFLIHFSGPTSGYPQTPIGNKNSLNYADCSLFLFLQAITSVLHCSVKQQALLKKNSLDVIQRNGSELFGQSPLQICQMFNSGSS